MQGLSKEALDALGESLDLSKLEMQELARRMQDMKSLEQALQALQMAKKLNEMGKLDGEGCQGCKGVGDYQKLYEKMLAEGLIPGGEGDGWGIPGRGPGGGTGGEGMGNGGRPPENEATESGFQSERSRSAMTAGKILMEWKTKGMSEAGEAKVDYKREIGEIRKGASEAILKEQVPPGLGLRP